MHLVGQAIPEPWPVHPGVQRAARERDEQCLFDRGQGGQWSLSSDAFLIVAVFGNCFLDNEVSGIGRRDRPYSGGHEAPCACLAPHEIAQPEIDRGERDGHRSDYRTLARGLPEGDGIVCTAGDSEHDNVSAWPRRRSGCRRNRRPARAPTTARPGNLPGTWAGVLSSKLPMSIHRRGGHQRRAQLR
jgi:hypothetical protein